jgi:hypothetical protein
MAAFATAEDFATYIQKDLSAPETATASQALDIASEVIRGYTGQLIDAVANESVTIRPLRGNSGVLLLAQVPVTSVDSVTEDGTLLVTADDYAWSEAGIIWRVGAVQWIDPVVVVYDHGFTTIPADVKGVCLALTAAMFGGGGTGIESESLGLYQVSYAMEMLSRDGWVRRVLDRYRA